MFALASHADFHGAEEAAEGRSEHCSLQAVHTTHREGDPGILRAMGGQWPQRLVRWFSPLQIDKSRNTF